MQTTHQAISQSFVPRLEHFSPLLVPFPVSRVRDTRLLWLNVDALRARKPFARDTQQEVPAHFLEEFSYAMTSTPCFSELPFDECKQRTLYAERYGGDGLGTNAGGSRVGLWHGHFQLKGIGANPLLGNGESPSHSYGGLDLHTAVNEIIGTEIARSVLPLGAVPMYGLIYLGCNRALSFTRNDCPSVILVREATSRPAHFMRGADLFEDPLRDRDDVRRTRAVLDELGGMLSARQRDVSTLLRNFLTACARQFSMARATRLAHHTLSASNIAFDGRWLDLPMSGFVPAGRNWTQASSFYDEAFAPLEWVDELAHVLRKYTGESVDVASLADRYACQLCAYFSCHAAFVLGFPGDFLEPRLFGSEWHVVVHAIEEIIFADGDTEPMRPEPSHTDAIVDFAEGLFLRLKRQESPSTRMLSEAHKAGVRVAPAFLTVAQRVYEATDFPSPSLNGFLVTCCLVSLKRAHLCQLFYFGHFNAQTESEISAGDLSRVSEYLNDTCRLVAVAVSGASEVVTLLSLKEARLDYDVREQRFHLNLVGNVTRERTRLGEIVAEIERSGCDLSHRGFDFLAYLFRLSKVVDALIDQEENTHAS